MSIFESLCDEIDDRVRRVGILDLAPPPPEDERILPTVRDKISNILSEATVPHIMRDAKGGIAQVVYQTHNGRIILTSRGISRVDDFGTTWEVVTHQPESTP